MNKETNLKYLIIVFVLLQIGALITLLRDQAFNLVSYFITGMIELVYCSHFYIKRNKSLPFKRDNFLDKYFTEEEIVKNKRRNCYLLLSLHIFTGLVLLTKRYFFS